MKDLVDEAVQRIRIPDLIVDWHEKPTCYCVKIKKGSIDTIGALWVQLVEVLINEKLAESVLDVPEIRVQDEWFVYVKDFSLHFYQSDFTRVAVPIRPVILRPVVIAIGGPSGVGKTTIGKRIVRLMPNLIRTYPVYTTRPIRDGEINGVDYHFRSNNDLEMARQDPYCSDFVQARDNWYWINRWEVLKSITTNHKNVHLFFMTQRHEFMARAKFFPWMDWIWLDAPDDQIVKRLKERGDSNIENSLAHNAMLRNVDINDLVSFRIHHLEGQYDKTLEKIIDFIEKRRKEK